MFVDGDCALRQGDAFGDTFFILYRGTMVERVVDENGEITQVRELGPGDVSCHPFIQTHFGRESLKPTEIFEKLHYGSEQSHACT